MLFHFCRKLFPSRSARVSVALPLLAIPLFDLLATPALAQRIINIPADQPTIQSGINAASNGDTVLVAPGTYYENVDFNGKAITVTSSAGATSTIIDGSATSKGAVVRFISGETRSSTIAGFTIQKGSRDPSGQFRPVTGGVYVGNSSQATILNNIIRNNFCEQIHIENGSALIRGNTISDPAPPDLGACDVYQGADILIFGGGNPSYPQPPSNIQNNVIENSPAVQGFSGLAIGLWVAPTTIIQNNIIRNDGSALLLENGNSLTFTGNLVYGNRRPIETTAGGSYASIQIHAAGSFSVGSFNGIFTGNTIADNTSANPSSLLNGVQTSPQVFISGDLGRWVFGNNVVIGTSANPALVCDPLYNDNAFTPISFDHNDIWNTDGTAAFTGPCALQFGTYGNVSVDPGFRNAAQADYHLAASSSLLDQGNTSMPGYFSTDLDGNPRVSSGNSGSYSTMDPGALELQGTAATAATIIQAQPSTYFPYAYNNVSAFSIKAALSSPLGIPTGVVTFWDNGAFLASGTIDASGNASFAPPAVAKGLHSYVVTYAGQGVFPPGISVRFYMRFDTDFTNNHPTTTTLAATPATASLGSPVKLNANVASPAGTPSGTVTFFDSGAQLGTAPLTAGAATITVTNLSRGMHALTAVYSGDNNFATSTGNFTERVVGSTSTTVLNASATNVPANAPIILTASTAATSGSAPDPSKLQILDGTTPLGSLAVGGNGVTATVTLAPGTHILTAAFAGDSYNEPSTSAPVTVVVQGAPTTTTLSADPAQPTAFHGFYAVFTTTAAAGTPHGSITLTADGQQVSSGTVSGPITFTSRGLLSLPAGQHTLVETYTPVDATTLPSSATLLLSVVRAPVSLIIGSAPAPFPQSQPATLTASLDDGTGRHLATGTITPLIDGTAQSAIALTATGQVSVLLQGLSIGTHSVAFSYSGDANFLPATTSAVQFTVLQRDFALKNDTSLSIPAGTYVVRTLTLTSIGGFTDAVTLSCDNLPVSASCRFEQSPVTMSAGGTATVQFALDTSALPGYQQSAALRNTRHGGAMTRLAGLLCPLAGFAGLFLLRARRRSAMAALLLLTFATLGTTAALTGCSGQLPAYTPPGTYAIRITGTSPGIIHSQAVTLQVTAPQK